MEVGAALRSPVFLFRSSELGSRSRFLPPRCANSLHLGLRGRLSYGSVQVLADSSSTCFSSVSEISGCPVASCMNSGLVQFLP